MASLSSSRFHAMRGVQAHARYALQLHRPDLGEGHVDPLGGIDDLLCDEDLPGRAYSAIREARFTVRP